MDENNLLASLPPEIIEQLHKKVQSRILPRPADTDPVLGRSINRARKRYPIELSNSKISPMPWENNEATSNVMGSTNPKNEITLNPAMLALFPEIRSDRTLAHELKHVDQNLDRYGDERAQRAASYQFMMPYEERPDEIEAFNESDKFERTLPKDYVNKSWASGHNINDRLLAGIPPLLKRTR